MYDWNDYVLVIERGIGVECHHIINNILTYLRTNLFFALCSKLEIWKSLECCCCVMNSVINVFYFVVF